MRAQDERLTTTLAVSWLVGMFFSLDVDHDMLSHKHFDRGVTQGERPTGANA
jgi:hypothetical protein